MGGEETAGRAMRGPVDQDGPLGGRYRLIEQLGAGGMSVVWRGYDEVLGRQVAVKVLAPWLAGDRAFRHRIRIEAQAAARLCHPNMTNVYDYGEASLAGSPVPYVVMELVDGESLAARLARSGRLPWQRAVTIGAEVAAALATAHARGIVHRDVHPGNVMLTANGAKVVDFGISALVGQREVGPDGQLLGTPAYLAPERLDGGSVAAPADVYALGLLLYRALTGRYPWPVKTTTEFLRAHLFTEPAALPPISGLPAEVVELCTRCLAKDPARRPESAELARGLARAVASGRTEQPTADRPNPSDADTDHDADARARAGAGTDRLPALPAGTGTVILPWSVETDALPLSVRSTAGGSRPSGGHRGDRAPAGRRGRLRAMAGRRRKIEVAAVGLGLVALTGAVWAGVSAVPTGGTAGLTEVPAGVGPPAGCQVEYALRQDTGSEFEAGLTVTNTGPDPVADWALTFALPGDQTVARATAGDGSAAAPAGDGTRAGGQAAADSAGVGWRQQGRELTIEPADGGPAALASGAAATFALAGQYRTTNALPTEFRIGDLACQARVTGVPGMAAAAPGGGVTVTHSPTKASDSRAPAVRPERAGPAAPKAKGKAKPPKPGKPPKPARHAR